MFTYIFGGAIAGNIQSYLPKYVLSESYLFPGEGELLGLVAPELYLLIPDIGGASIAARDYCHFPCGGNLNPLNTKNRL